MMNTARFDGHECQTERPNTLKPITKPPINSPTNALIRAPDLVILECRCRLAFYLDSFPSVNSQSSQAVPRDELAFTAPMPSQSLSLDPIGISCLWTGRGAAPAANTAYAGVGIKGLPKVMR